MFIKKFNERELDLLMNFMGLIVTDYETNRIQFLRKKIIFKHLHKSKRK